MVMIDGIEIDVDAEAVVVSSRHPLRVVSSAVVGGGLGSARAIVNLHVPRSFRSRTPETKLAEFARRRSVPAPYVGLLTAALTEKAEVASAAAGGLAACAIVTVGLGNTVAAGRTGVTAWRPSTINTIVLVDADPEPGALVNLLATATEAKALALAEAGIRSREGGQATGTSTDAVAIAATGRGPMCRFGGPSSDLGWIVARVAKSALDVAVRRWVEEHAD